MSKKNKSFVIISIILSGWYLLSYPAVYLPQFTAQVENYALVKILNAIGIFFVTGVLGDGAIGVYLVVPVILAAFALIAYFIMKDLSAKYRKPYLFIPLLFGAFTIIGAIVQIFFAPVLTVVFAVDIAGSAAWLVYCIYILCKNRKKNGV